ncbi:hypothetical protein EAJSRFBN_CDS0166 [Salmonella phage SeKF_19]|uniref:Uncharacterized protein n=3 Tax=unclassified Kuttervirus TaxID=2770329 RepID=A0AAU8GHU1_9CAUD|nr:hypothetical protein SeF6a_173 [Salmonella phage SeF6a]
MFTSCMNNKHSVHYAGKQNSLLIHSNLMENSRNTRSGIFLREKS